MVSEDKCQNSNKNMMHIHCECDGHRIHELIGILLPAE